MLVFLYNNIGDNMLIDLKILNGNLDVKFDKYTYLYTVRIDNDLNKLDFSYILDNNVSINIRDNNNITDGSIVYIDVFNGKRIITYTFNIYKDDTNEVINVINIEDELLLEKSNENFITTNLLFTVMFFIIIFLYLLIFRKLKK